MSEFDELLKKFEATEKEASPEDNKLPVLLIDDDESIRRGLSRALSHKYNVKMAESGTKGIELLSKDIYCVILDVKMKHLNGFSTYPKLKSKCPDVPIIFFTAFQSEHDLQEVINKYKPEGYVEKGRDISFLENLIGNAVQKYRLVLENEEYKKELERNIEALNEAYKQLELQHVREKKLERTITGGFAHEMRNALTGGMYELMDIVKHKDNKSAVQKLNDLAVKMFEFIISLEKKYSVPKELIDKEVVPNVKQMNGIIKLLDKTIHNVSQDMGRGLGLTKQILNYSKLHEMKRGSRPVNMTAIIKRLGDVYASRILKSNINYKVNIPGDDFIIIGDNIQIESIVQNLLLNAIDAVEESTTKEIEMSLSKQNINENIYFRVNVRDTGHGISEDNLEHLFDPFFTKKYSTGTGLGLSIAKRMAELYDGQIHVESKEGEGTKFTVDLLLE